MEVVNFGPRLVNIRPAEYLIHKRLVAVGDRELVRGLLDDNFLNRFYVSEVRCWHHIVLPLYFLNVLRGKPILVIGARILFESILIGFVRATLQGVGLQLLGPVEGLRASLALVRSTAKMDEHVSTTSMERLPLVVGTTAFDQKCTPTYL